MYKDEIISEVWKNREQYAKEHHHNLHEIVADLQKRQQNPLSPVVDRRRPTAHASETDAKGKG